MNVSSENVLIKGGVNNNICQCISNNNEYVTVFGTNIISLSNIKENNYHHWQFEALSSLNTKIGIFIDDDHVLKEDEYECIEDLLSIKDKDLQDMGLKRGARKAIIRKFAAEKKKRGIVDIVEGGIDGGNVIHALVNALNGNKGGMKNEGNNNEQKEKEESKKVVKKVWDKRGTRSCYIGPVLASWLPKYQAFILALILLAFEI
eukprot:477762_1